VGSGAEGAAAAHLGTEDGSGPLGLLAALTCRVLGLETHVWSMSPVDGVQAKLARGCGAVYHQAGGTDGGGPAAKTLTELAGSLGKRIDLIWECTGYSPLAFEAIGALGPNGVLALLGVTPGKRTETVPVDVLNRELVLENKCVFGSVNAARKHFETGLYRLQRMDERYPDVLRGIVTNRLRLEDVPGFDFAKVAVKAVVDVVPAGQWERLVRQPGDAAYSFSV
jgi:threonine dehydrogenase-like Zn-dependent dehydrogenase